ncbi:Hypothetical protein, predicted lipoprotein [Metamycoplasma auris 15026]|uniref:Uncharacterized protein n=1 Tax=Metamycoplasma auris 15026 TaxID=1188233 RepID=N9TT14_9BACT|nr:variable surface lipoprotein [Metamycoplasma auris]ENY69185.1 Hypothetical protein, predicted lipoprotein [Metamycoplasma auris 15026]
MKKSFKLLLATAAITTIATPLLAASCNTKELQEKQAFKSLIDKIEKEVKDNATLKQETKEQIDKLLGDAKKKLEDKEKENDPKFFSEAISELSNKYDEIKKKDPGNQGNKDKDSSTPSKSEKDGKGEDTGKEKKDEKKNKGEEGSGAGKPVTPETTDTPPSTPSTPKPQPQPIPKSEREPKPPADEPRKEEPNEMDEVVKNLQDIFTPSFAQEDFDELRKFKTDSSSYSLWYDKDKRNIVLIKGSESPFEEKNKDKDNYAIFGLGGNASQIKSNIQLVNHNKPATITNKDGHEIVTLSNKLDFRILKDEGNDKFYIEINYRVAKFLNNETSIISTTYNKSRILVELK